MSLVKNIKIKKKKNHQQYKKKSTQKLFRTISLLFNSCVSNVRVLGSELALLYSICSLLVRHIFFFLPENRNNTIHTTTKSKRYEFDSDSKSKRIKTLCVVRKFCLYK